MALLPQELFDAIIDKIHDKETLKACALLSSAFLPPSQRKLFRKVLIGLGRRSRNTTTALAESPHLVSYIRDLTIVMPSTVPISVAVAGVLRSVQNIESLVVSGIAPGVNWNSVEHEARSTLLDCLLRPSLRSLQLSGMQDVSAALISAATAVPVVSFFDIRMDVREEISEQLHASAPAPRLRRLTLGDAGPAVRPICDFLLHPRKPAYTQQIERLSIRIDQDNASYAGRIMAACAATLKYLVVNPKDITRLPLLPFVLEFEIKVWVGYDRRLPAFFSQNISQIASSIPLAETITLAVFVRPIHPGPEIQWADEAPLPIFGPSFMDRAQLLHLRRVHCILRRQGPFDDISALFDRFVLAMESMMPGLRGTGILRCTLDNPQQRSTTAP
ncbi:hypothetical protein DFH08DRAFT_1075074 [Mycena albidolilacea]|uniref:F-box domain-containing protein n=1 Tax=Mycena albidolilacea TaxID=1033008 RepID=A0AAD7AJ45_9AGAR|nr:hypothetical protein DFH08DRAFT_1075074 [Mycena albidolilacea]